MNKKLTKLAARAFSDAVHSGADEDELMRLCDLYSDGAPVITVTAVEEAERALAGSS